MKTQEIAFKLNDWLNFYWNFYIVLVIAVSGWMIQSNLDLTKLYKTLLVLFIIGFSSISINAITKTYIALESINKKLIETGEEINLIISKKFSQKYWKFSIFGHIITDLGIIYIVLNK